MNFKLVSFFTYIALNVPDSFIIEDYISERYFRLTVCRITEKVLDGFYESWHTSKYCILLEVYKF